MSAHPIVVGIDGSETSAAALDLAVDEAGWWDTSLLIVHAVSMPLVAVPFGSMVVVPPTDDLEKYSHAVLAEATQRAQDRSPGIQVQTASTVLPPAEALLRESAEATAVVVGSRGLGAIGTTFLGSVSTRVSSRAECPTIVVSSAPAHPSGPIVVGVDGSPHAAAAAQFALAEAARRECDVIAVHAFALPMSGVEIDDDEDAARQRDAARRDAMTLLTETVEAARESRSSDVEVELRPIEAGAPDALTEAGSDASLTVVGSRGRGGFAGMVLGSVSQAILHHATNPVAVVHADT